MVYLIVYFNRSLNNLNIFVKFSSTIFPTKIPTKFPTDFSIVKSYN